MALKVPGAKDGFVFSGEGAFDASSKRASMSLDLSSLAKLLGGFAAGLGGPGSSDMRNFDDPAGWRIQVVQDGKVAYVRLPAFDDKLPAGKSWIRVDGNDVRSGAFGSKQLDGFTHGDPRQVLDALRGVTGDVETVGSEELRGVETTHYRAVVDSTELAKQVTATAGQDAQSLFDQLTSQTGLTGIPVDVWLDADGLVRKLSLALTANDASGSEGGSVTMTFELWDYGEDVAIDVPPAAQSSTRRRSAGSHGQRFRGTPVPPAQWAGGAHARRPGRRDDPPARPDPAAR